MTDIAVRTVSNDVAPSTGAKNSGSARAACERRACTCTAIMLLMSKESEAAANRTTRKTVARTMAAPDSDVRCRLPDDLCVRSVLIGISVFSGDRRHQAQGL